MSSTWDRTRCTCWWWTHTRAPSPLPAYSHKVELRLAQLLDEGRRDRSARASTSCLRSFVQEPLQAAEDKGVRGPPAVRHLRRSARPATPTTILARDAGPRSGRRARGPRRRGGGPAHVPRRPPLVRLVRRASLLVLDIGGGSLEIAYGIDEEPDAAVSLPLGAGRLTAGPGCPPTRPTPSDVTGRCAATSVRRSPARSGRVQPASAPPDHVVATSKTFKQLARIAGAAPLRRGPRTSSASSSASPLEAWAAPPGRA